MTRPKLLEVGLSLDGDLRPARARIVAVGASGCVRHVRHAAGLRRPRARRVPRCGVGGCCVAPIRTGDVGIARRPATARDHGAALRPPRRRRVSSSTDQTCFDRSTSPSGAAVPITNPTAHAARRRCRSPAERAVGDCVERALVARLVTVKGLRVILAELGGRGRSRNRRAAVALGPAGARRSASREHDRAAHGSTAVRRPRDRPGRVPADGACSTGRRLRPDFPCPRGDDHRRGRRAGCALHPDRPWTPTCSDRTSSSATATWCSATRRRTSGASQLSRVRCRAVCLERGSPRLGRLHSRSRAISCVAETTRTARER